MIFQEYDLNAETQEWETTMVDLAKLRGTMEHYQFNLLVHSARAPNQRPSQTGRAALALRFCELV